MYNSLQDCLFKKYILLMFYISKIFSHNMSSKFLAEETELHISTTPSLPPPTRPKSEMGLIVKICA